MNSDILSGIWKQARGQVRETWGKLTDDEVEQINGQRDQLAGKLQEKYGYTRAQADQEIDRFLKNTETKLRDKNNP